MTPADAPIYVLAEALGQSYGDPRGYEAVRVVVALLSGEVLVAIANRTSLETDVVREHLVAMAALLTERNVP